MTIIIQQPKDSNGNPQPMVYDSDSGKIIVDSEGYVLMGMDRRLVNVPTKANFISTPKTQTSGIQEAINYVSVVGGKIKLLAGRFVLDASLPLKEVDTKFQIFSGYYGPLYAYLSIPTVSASGSTIKEIDIEGSGGLTQPSENGNDFDYENSTIIDASALNPQSSPTYYNGDMYTVLYTGGQFNSSIISNLIVIVNSPFLSGLTVSGDSNKIENCFAQNLNGTPPSSVYTNPNGAFTSTQPYAYQWGIYIDAEYGITGTIVNCQANYFDTGIVVSVHIFAPNISTDYCRIGVALVGDHPPAVGILCCQQNTYVNISCSAYLQGPVNIMLLDGEDNSSTYGDIQDIMCEIGVYPQVVNIESFHMEATNQTANPRLPYVNLANFPYPASLRINNINASLSRQTIDGTTAGTIKEILQDYGTGNIKYIFHFSGYENDTTTNQAITFPIAYLSSNAVVINTTGLTISVTLTGLTITAPDATTTYSGLIIIEGY